MNSPAYYRARLHLIQQLILGVKDDGTKNNDSTVLKSGTIPTGLLQGKNEYQVVSELMELTDFSNDPLTFAELTTWNTWFAMHPEKVAGEEKVTTSLQFPITIVGTRADIEKAVHRTLDEQPGGRPMKEIEMEALALEIELELLEL